MGGYLGTKAVFLSTTAASVGGDATIGGDLTVGGALNATTSAKVLYQSVVIEDSGSYTLTAGNTYNIIAFGGGGAGGSAVVGPNIDDLVGAAAAQGGATGGIVQKYVSVSGSDLTLTITIGAGGSGATADTATPRTATGGDGGDTTVTGTGISITAEGGQGGGAAQTNLNNTSVSVAAMSTRASGSGGDQTTEGKIVGSVSSGDSYSSVNVGASFGGDVANVSDYIKLAVNGNETVAGEEGIVPFALFQEISGSSGLRASTGGNLNETAGTGGYACGGGAQISRSSDTSSINHQATGGDGGQGFVIINEYKELT